MHIAFQIHNGLANFSCAIDFIHDMQLPGVFVAYQNPGQAMQIYRGTRLVSCLPLGSDFMGVQSLAFQDYVQNQYKAQEVPLGKQPVPINLKADFSARILLIRPYPGLNYAHFNLDNVDVVLHDLYHSGTACTSGNLGETHNLLTLIQRCQQLEIPVYLARL